MSGELLILVVTIGIADSLNPATVAPALFLATTEHPRRQVGEFAGAFCAVNFAGGVVIALGPGQLILSLLPRPSPTAKHFAELVGGAAVLIVAGLLLAFRGRLRHKPLAPLTAGRRSGLALGAAIGAVELPTALPYFAAIAAILASEASFSQQLLLLALFNVAFMLPVLAILVLLVIAGERANRLMEPLGRGVQRYWPTLVGGLLAALGGAAVAFGVAGLASG
jgi:cytochrome c biogenesis protein CcdA